MIKTLLKDPLLHFALIGGLLFSLYIVVAEPAVNNASIVISTGQIEALKTNWQKVWNRPPSDTELQQIVQQSIREEVLYREAKLLGLDKDDQIIKRRLQQKMEFMFTDISYSATPTNQQLKQYLADNSAKFISPARHSFKHFFINRDQRGTEASEDALHMLAGLRAGESTASGDRFMFANEFIDANSDEIIRVFGENFYTQLAALNTGGWQGPITSRFGYHLVFIIDMQPPGLPLLSDIRERVSEEFRATQRQVSNEAFYQALLAKYQLRIDWPKKQLAAIGTSQQ
jgi:peptidyl-prolyl cis-trans isomerase C